MGQGGDGRSEERPGLSRAIVALRHRDYRFFYLAIAASHIAMQFQGAVILWHVWEITQSPVALGLTGLARAIPIIAFSLVGGVVADRVDRRHFLIATHAAAGLLTVVMAAASLADAVEVGHLYVFILVNTMLIAGSGPARFALTPSLVPREHLMNALALNSTVWQIGNISGPSAAGILLALLGIPVAYAMNAVVFLVVIGGMAAIRVRPALPSARESPLRSFIEGMRFVRIRSIILVLLATDTAAMFFGTYRGLLPIIATDVLSVGPEGLGLLLSAPAIGGLAGAFVVMYMGNFPYKGLMVVAAIVIYCAFLVGLALSPWLLLSLAISILLGLTDSLQATPRNGVIQLVTPDELRGRVGSLQQMLTTGVPSLGQTQGGIVAQAIADIGGVGRALGAQFAIAGGGLVCAAIVLAIAVLRTDLRARDLGSEPVVPAPAAPRAPKR